MPAKTKLPQTGGCRCGALRYELAAAPLYVANCHCTNCQKISGSAFSTNAAVSESAFRFTQGEPAVDVWKADSGNERFGWFCRACGSRIAHGQTPSIGFLSLRTGGLDDTSWVEPVGDIWTKSAQGWAPSRRLSDKGQPKDYGPFVEAYRAQGRF